MSSSTVLNRLNRQIAYIAKAYNKTANTGAVEEALSFSNVFSHRLFLIYIIREGVPYDLFDAIQEYAPFTEQNWANFLDLSTKTLQRHKLDAKHFRPLQSEKIIEMAEVTTVGLDVFGDMEKFKLWLDTPNFALGKMKPIELLKGSYGKEMVLGELNRINHGILA
jgi:putative toxin-antitoxin system antitoxin component (TIGR02293 family)